jgi:Flp pilus assembly protein TadB
MISMLVSSACYFILLAGFWVISKEQLRCLWARLRMYNRLKARKRELKPESALEQHLRKILSISLKRPMKPKVFLRYTAAGFALILIAGFRTAGPATAFLMAALISSMPYLLLRVRVESIRRRSSFEGEKLISEFLCQYRISGLNIYRAIEQVILVSEGTKITARLLFKLLLELRNTGNPQVIKEATERFAYGINTNWSRMLANCIRISAESGVNVTLALEDIQIQLREARLLFEERKRLNSESARMVVFLAPLMYLGTVVMSVKYLGISLGKLMGNQFRTEQGFLMILLIAFLFFINLALIEIINNQRFDY